MLREEIICGKEKKYKKKYKKKKQELKVANGKQKKFYIAGKRFS